MLDYSFQTLSPIEFEALSRDLLQKYLGLTLESFTSGRDGGVDLRYSKPKSDYEIIIQCKRHISTYRELKRHLVKSELPKVKKLNPKRYILVTSVGLTKHNKSKIMEDFSPYIQASSDIFGRDDINNLLGVYKDIEIQNYKLWLSSINILQQILHTDILNRTAFEEDDINRVVSLYVENDSYRESMEVFSKNRFVIISGSPGIGKTTLARMMIYRLLAEGKFEQFVYISRGVEEAIKLYVPDKKQLFFFDDFLGKNYFENGFDRNEDSELIKFIERVSSSKNKGLILTTREYILKQAQLQYVSLESKLITDNKYIIDLEKYTKIIRAKILYNHLFVYGVPYDYLTEFLNDKTYNYLISHKNYTPRLIETILKEKPWEIAILKEFPDVFKKYFDEPNKLWEDAYRNGISEDARKLLKILFTLKTPLALSRLYTAFDASFRDLPTRQDYHVFECAFKELENTFVDTRSSYSLASGNTLIIDYKNPSILDFLLDYFVDSKRNDLLAVLKYPIYIDQLILRFTNENDSDLKGQVVMTPEISSLISNSILSGFDKLPFCDDVSINQYSYSIKTYPQVQQKILKNMRFLDQPEVYERLYSHFLEFNELEERGDFDSLNYLLELFESKMTDAQVMSVLTSIVRAVYSMDDYEWFISRYANDRINNCIDKWMEENGYQLDEQAKEIIIEEMRELDLGELEEYETKIDYYHTSLGLDVTEINEAYEEALCEAKNTIIDEYDYEDLSPGPAPIIEKPIDEDAEIHNMFESLR